MANNIKPDLCTHIIYAFAKLKDNAVELAEKNDPEMMNEINGFKTSNPGLKTILGIGGFALGSTPFSNLAQSETNRQTFIASTLAFLRQYSFDGVDIDWAHPTKRGGRPVDKANFVTLLQELKSAFLTEATASGRERLLLIADVSTLKGVMDSGYDIPNLARELDMINLKTYDLNGHWNNFVGFNSPLYPRSDESETVQRLNIEWGANEWATRGMDKSKINIGLAAYGRTFKLRDPSNNAPGAASNGAGAAGPITMNAGLLAYYEICAMLQSGQGKNYWNDEQKCPYYFNGELWVGYEDVRSVREKAEWVKDNGFAGVTVYAMDYDDFGPTCASTRYPLHQAVSDVFGGQQTPLPPTTPPTPPPTTPSIRQTTPLIPGGPTTESKAPISTVSCSSTVGMMFLACVFTLYNM